jgi:hypothetical protein
MFDKRCCYDIVLPNLYVGPFPESSTIIPADVHVVLNLSRESTPPPAGVVSCHMPFCYWELDEPIYLLCKLCNLIQKWQTLKKCVLVHCRLGLDRTGIVTLSFLVHSGMTPGDALRFYRTTRNCRLPRSDAMIVFWKYTKLVSNIRSETQK